MEWWSEERRLSATLSSVHLGNVCLSLDNKMDELLLLNSKIKDFSCSSVQCFTEIWFIECILAARSRRRQ